MFDHETDMQEEFGEFDEEQEKAALRI